MRPYLFTDKDAGIQPTRRGKLGCLLLLLAATAGCNTAKVTAKTDLNPAAAATIILSPISIPVHFVLAGGDLRKNAQYTGAKIAQEVARRVPPAADTTP